MKHYIYVYIILLFCGVLCLNTPFEAVAQSKPNSKVVALCKKADQYINQHNFEKAMDCLKQAKQKDSSYSDIYVLMGDIYNFTLHADSAVACYNKAISLIGEPDPMLYCIAGNEGVKCGQYDNALHNYELFLKKGLHKLRCLKF